MGCNPVVDIDVKPQEHDIHLIMNEIYFMSVHAVDAHPHVSILSFDQADLPHKEKLHIVWGMLRPSLNVYSTVNFFSLKIVRID